MRVLVAGMLLVTLSALPAQSQELSAEDKYLRRLKVNDAIDPTGTSLFGEQVNLYTGDLTFRHTDVVLEGTGPTISLTRELASVQTSEARMRPHSMGDWVLAIPRIETLTQGPLGSGPVTNPGQQWIVAPLSSADATKRCTLFNRPLYTGGLDDPEDAWNGMDLVTESGERQSLLRRVASSPSAPTVQNGGSAIVFKALTLGNWHIGCLANTSNGEDGEAFIAVAPDGTKYWLNYLTGERAYTVFEQKDGANFRQFRMFANMYASRVEDRFGNFVTYSYTGDQLTAITASDGRAVSLSWRTDAPVISQITVNPGTADQRVWQYQYNVASAEVVTLTGVVLPDGTSWQFNLAGVGGRAATHPDLHKCGLRTLSATGGGSSSTIAHPSGATGTFVVGSRWHSRSYVPTTCLYPNGLASPGVEGIQTVFGGNSLLSKTISGPGLTPSTWSYAYSVAAGSSTSDACAASSTCVDTRWVDVTGPAGDRTRYTYSNRWGAHEGKLLKTETFQGVSTLLRTETSTYAAATEGPYPAKVGEVLAVQNSNFTKQETWTPLKTAVTAQQGVTFSRATTTFDTLSRPLTNTLSSSLGYSKTESTAYSDFPSLGVLGAVREQKVDGTVTFSTTFTAKAQPWVVSNFGSVVQTLTYQADGNLATAKDALNNVTTLSNWKRGVPQNVTFADNSYLTAEVNNNGWLKWVEDEARSRTCYTFDAMGRLTSITYTSESATNTCNTSTWAATTQSFAPSAIGRYGLPAGYWIQYVDTGKGRTVRHFDALWRPVLEEQFDNTDNPTALATRSMVVKRYDAEGQLEFQSYPVASLTTIGDASLKGVWSEYDALGRIKSSTQDSELGLLPTVTEYLTGFKVKVTSPKLQSTTTSFMAFDAPTQDWPVLMEHPESAFTHITRDKYGKPTKIRRSNNVSPTGGTLAVDRSYTYNAKQELCASTEPETGTTLMGYDAAGNLSWSAAGLAAGTACDANGTTPAVVLRKAARTYDARNRLSTLTFPDGLGNQVWTYLPTGKPGVLKAYNAANNGEPVVTTYSYNRRGLLYHERLVTSLLDWPYEYKYNANGHLASNNWHGIVVAYAPNQLGQPTQAGSYASNVQYFPNGAVKQFTYGNGIVHTLTQNARQLPARSVDGALLDLSYAYDKNANVASITDATAGARQSRTMTYDNLDRLLTASGPSFGAATYGYDVLDNLSGVKVTGGMHPRDHSYHYDLGNRLDSVTQVPGNAMVIALSYDPQGNVYNKNGVVHKFDYGNRLREVEGKGSYLYDAHGRRVRDTINGVAAHSQYLMNGQLAFSTDSRTGKVREHIYLGDDPVAIRERDAPTNVYTYRYLHTDGLGSALVETDATQTVLERSEYEPYGALTNRADKDDVGYTGHRQDASTGLTYMQQRYYDSELGRFLSTDPVAVSKKTAWNFNRFNYAANNSYRFNDPDGRIIKIAGDAAFKEKVLAALDKLLSKPGGAALVKQLHSSTHVFKIVATSNGNGTGLLQNGANQLSKAMTPGVGASGKIYFNPNNLKGGVDSTGSQERPAFIGLGHELAHAKLMDEGRYNIDNGSRQEGTTPPSEKEVLPVENQIRNEHGLPTRNSYYD